MSEHQDKSKHPNSSAPDEQTHTHLPKASGSSSKTPSGMRYPVGEEPTIVSKNLLAAEASNIPLLSPSELATSLVGEKLGHFELEEIIGGGGMGTVFRARDTLLNRIVAVKILSQSHSANDDTRARFVNEAQSAARLDHENIARVYFIGEDQGVHYIVYEYIEGSNIRDIVLNGGPLPIVDALRFTLQISEALAHASKRDVVHRDIKPSNILVSEEGQARLVDMGLARLHQVEHSGDDLTASGVTLGTFDYISPEQARDPRSADVRSDLYSLGCTLFFMLAGRPPFPEGTVLQKLLQHQGDDLPDVTELRSDLPPELIQVLKKLCAKSPKKRYQHPKLLTQDLVLLAERIGISTVSNSKYLLPDQGLRKNSWSRHIPWLVPCGLLIVASLFLSLFESLGQDQAAAENWKSLSSQYEKLQPLEKSTGIESPASPQKIDTPEKSSDKEDATKLKATESQADKKVPVDNGETSAAMENGKSSESSKLQPVGSDEPSGTKNHPPTKTDDADAIDNTNQTPGTKTVVDSETTKKKQGGIASGRKLIVGDEKNADYQSLREAVAVARSGDFIELHYDGRRVEKPFTLNLDQKKSWNLTITAGKGYRPTLQFKPTSINPDQNPREMITVLGGVLHLSDIDLEMDLPKQIADRWTLFSLQSAHALHLTNCTLTIRNATKQHSARHPDVAFMRTAVKDSMNMESGGSAVKKLPQLIIQLRSCVARGEANFLSSNQLQPIKFSWDNGLLATTENMFSIESLSEKPKQSGYLIVNLTHTTVVALNGVFSAANTRQLPYQRDTRFSSSYNIFVGSLDETPGSPFIDQSGIDTGGQFAKRIDYDGDTNFYEAYDQIWEIQSDADDSLQSFDFESWNEHWEKKSGKTSFSYQDKVQWKKQTASKKPVHQHTVSDYLLSETENETTQVNKKREWDAGLHVKSLPKFPAVSTVNNTAIKKSDVGKPDSEVFKQFDLEKQQPIAP